MKLTKKETDFINQIKNSEFCDSEGDYDWVSNIDYDMNITRGLMSSLEKKGIIYIGDNDIGGAGQPMTWVEII